MKRTVLTIFALFMLFSVYSQKETAKQILTDVREHYNEDYAFEVDFVLETDIPETLTSEMSGILSLSGEQFKYETENQSIISDNVNLWYWTHTSDMNEVQISYVEDSADIISPPDIFNLYLKGFLYKITGRTTRNGKELTLIEIKPPTKEENLYFKTKAVIDTEADRLKELQVFYKDGTVYTFKINNENSSSFDVDYFSFDEKENATAEIIDLR